jgi:hypothetical protein
VTTSNTERKDLKSMEASKLDSLQYDDSYAKEQYYADSCRSDSAGHNKTRGSGEPVS